MKNEEILCKAKKFDPSKQNIVLTLGGSFYPIHKNHIRTIEYAKKIIEETRPDLNVMGLYLIPTQIECLSKKIEVKQKELKDIDAHRMKMCQLMVQNHPDIMVYSYLFNSQRNKGLTVATLRLQDTLNKCFNLCQKQKQEQIQAITVTGMDKFELLIKKSKNGPIVFIENRPTLNIDIKPEVIIENNNLQKFSENIIIIEDKENQQEISSTQIRQLCNSDQDFSHLVTPELYKYHQDNNIKYPLPSVQQDTQIEEDFIKSLPKIQEIVKFKYNSIEFNELSEIDMTQILGLGVQARVVQGIYKGDKVAIKLYSLEKEKSQKVKSFLRELRAFTLCKHPNIVELYGAGQHRQYLYLVLELASGKNLLDFVSRNRKYWDEKPFNKEFIRALSELCMGLNEMSNSGVLHRDIQTKNILIKHSDPNFNYDELKQFDENCTLKICDFGLSAIDEDKDKVLRGSTRHYAPESIESKLKYFPQSDVYMIGNSLWELVYTKIIFTKLTVGEVHTKVLASLREKFDHKCPKEIQNIIEKCWTHNYLERPSFLEVAQDLQKIYLSKPNEQEIQQINEQKQIDQTQ